MDALTRPRAGAPALTMQKAAEPAFPRRPPFIYPDSVSMRGRQKVPASIKSSGGSRPLRGPTDRGALLMFESLFGLPLAARFFIDYLVVLALIGVTAWVVRRFGASRLGGGARGSRQPRLAVIDAASVDGRRRLVLIRRDNIEHLLMIGGPSDVVVESNIVRAAGAAPREAGRIDTPPTRDGARTTPPADTGWPLQPLNDPPALAPGPAAAATRFFRAAATEEPWTPPEPGARPRPSENLSGLAAELSSRLAAPDLPPPPVVPRHESAAPRVAVTAVPPEPP